MNQVEIIKIIKDTVKVPTFTNGDVYSVWNTNEIKYSAVNVSLENAEVDNDMVNYSFIIYYGDRLLPDESNFEFIQVDAFRVLTSLINELSEVDDIDIPESYIITPFQQQFADYLAGAYVRLTITSGHSLEYCYPVVDRCPSCTVDFSLIYNNDLASQIEANIASDIEYTKSLFDAWNPNSSGTYQLYRDNKNLVYAPEISTSNASNMARMFYGCVNLVTVPLYDTKNVFSMERMFYNCTSLKNIQQYDTSFVNNMESTFQHCTSLKSIPSLNTYRVTTFSSTFYGCSNLETVESIDTSSATNLNYMFYNCTSLVNVPSLNTSKATTINYMFYGCNKIKSIPLLDFTNVTSAQATFYNCQSLETIGGFMGLSVNMELNSCNKLTHESLINVLNNLATVSGKTLNLGSTNLNKLTEDEKTIATNKGWTLK